MKEKEAIGPEFWESHYASQVMPWDLAEPSPPFVQLMKERGDDFPQGKLAVLGSGQGHDAGFFGKLGFDVTGFDYAQGAVALAQDKYGEWARFEWMDIFKIPDSYNATFDYILEHTCLCALHPDLRQDYADLVYRLLKPNGRLMALFFAHEQEGGPPYRITEAEILELFLPQRFELDSLKRTPYSHESRKGLEYLGVFRRKH